MLAGWRFRLVASCIAAAAALGVARLAHAHGTMLVPESRIHRCAFDGNIENHQDPACRAAIDLGGKQPLYDWNGVRQAAAAGNHRGLIPDGQLCGGGNADFVGLNLPRTDWRTTPIAPAADGSFEFVWHATAPHATRDWGFYVTRDGWNAAQALRWSDVEQFCSAGSVPLVGDGQGRQVYRIRCPLPARQGRHVLFTTWQRSDSDEAFYSCSDVVFLDGGGSEWTQIGSVQAPQDLDVGSLVTFRLFDEAGHELEWVDVTLAVGQQTRQQWPVALALRVNQVSTQARIGVLNNDGAVVPTTVLNGNFVYAAPGRRLSFEIDIARPAVTPIPATPTRTRTRVATATATSRSGTPTRTPTASSVRVYPTGIGSYGPGTIVRGSDGRLYQCRPFPYSGWCNQAPPYYAPGTGWNWQDAWQRKP